VEEDQSGLDWLEVGQAPVPPVFAVNTHIVDFNNPFRAQKTQNTGGGAPWLQREVRLPDVAKD